jgi:hypothetical protein
MANHPTWPKKTPPKAPKDNIRRINPRINVMTNPIILVFRVQSGQQLLFTTTVPIKSFIIYENLYY